MSVTLAPHHHGPMPTIDEALRCDPCDGTGEHQEEYDCSTCAGTGEVEEEDDNGDLIDVPCDGECDGSGIYFETEDCMNCWGRGHAHGDPELAEAVSYVLDDLHSAGFEVMLAALCCMSCSMAAARSTGRNDDGTPTDGYVPFVGFHEQDLERAYDKPSGGLYLFHDATEADRRRIVEAFEQADLNVEWDGSEGSRIKVTL